MLTEAKEVNAIPDEKSRSQSEETQAEGTPFLDCMAQMMSACCPEMKEWLQKGFELAKEFSPSTYSVSISVPMVGSISFSWSRQNEN